LTTYEKHTEAVFSLAWSPDSTRIASASNDGSVQVWNALDGQTLFAYRSLKMIKSAPAPWNAVAWSPDGKQLAIGGTGNTLILDARTGTEVANYGYKSGVVHNLAWSPNGQYLAVADTTGLVRVWSALTGQNIYAYQGHTSDVFAVAWSPDGQRIASASSDGTVQVWNALTGAHAYIYRGHADAYVGHFVSNVQVDCVVWSPDGKRLASGASDNTVQVWQAPS
jgi:WD40 repeat protein